MIAILLAATVVVERQWQTMGTIATGTVEADSRPAGLAALRAAAGAFDATEASLSTWRDDTDLARLNRAPAGTGVSVPPDLANLLRRVLEAAGTSGGAFDPTVGRLVAAWGLRTGGKIPAAEELAAARAATGHWLIDVDPHAARVVRRHPGVLLEEGAFGKGYALDLARAAMEQLPGLRAATLDAGGQILAWGARADGAPFRVGVAHPRHRAVEVAEVCIHGGSVATSGNSERGLVVDGTPVGHVLDPRTGHPALDSGSVTVVAPDALTADILSTTLMVLGPDQGLSWLGGRTDVAALFLQASSRGLHARMSPAMGPLLCWIEVPASCEP